MKNPADMTDNELQEILEQSHGSQGRKVLIQEEQKGRLREDIERCRGKLLRLKTILEEN